MVLIRDATFWDFDKVAGVLAASMAQTRLGQWLEPELLLRGLRLREYFRVGVADATRHGAVRLVGEHGDVLATAVWLPCLPQVDAPRPIIANDEFNRRLDRFLTVAEQPHLNEPHRRLVALGVPPGRQQHDFARALLADAEPGTPRCLLAVDKAMAELGDRCGYQPYGHAVSLAPGAVVQPMLFPVAGGTFWARHTARSRYTPPVSDAGASRSAP